MTFDPIRFPPFFQEPVPALACSLFHLGGIGDTLASRRQASKQQLVRVAFDIGCLEVALQHCNRADIRASALDGKQACKLQWPNEKYS